MERKTLPQLLLCLSLLLSLIVAIPMVPSASAYDYDYGAASELYSTDWLFRQCDLDQINYAFPQIYDLFAQQWWYVWNPYFGWVKYKRVYGHLWNLKSNTYAWRVTDQMHDMETYHDYATFFYCGHMGMHWLTGSPPDYNWPEWSYGFREQAAPDSGAPPVVWDDHHIYPNTANGLFHFVFLWVCNNGNTAGSASPIHGMPYCWTRRSLSGDGYGDPLIDGDPDGSSYCFIGFESASPVLSDWMGTYGSNGQQNIYKFWLVFFYYFALYYYQYTINQALDQASYMVDYEDGWLDSDNRLRDSQGYYYWPGGGGQPEGYYWGRMRIYGDGNIYLPASAALWW